MKVYVITRGEYSDYHICSVTLDKERAEKLAKLHSTELGDAKVEVYDTETVAENEALAGRFPYVVWFRPDGRVTSVYRLWVEDNDPVPQVGCFNDRLRVTIRATSEEAAIKIAAEKRAEFLAIKNGLV